jgi:hypothetical protein
VEFKTHFSFAPSIRKPFEEERVGAFRNIGTPRMAVRPHSITETAALSMFIKS